MQKKLLLLVTHEKKTDVESYVLIPSLVCVYVLHVIADENHEMHMR